MEFVGFDTETISGYCRLIGLSTGENFKIKDRAEMILFLQMQHGKNFIAYNADYDSQSILKYIPEKELGYILKGLEVEYEGIKFLYINKKYLKWNNNWLFDCYQYYQSKLAVAAEKYLHKKKGDVDASAITIKNIYTKKVIDYCVKDAKLAYQLFMKMYETLPKELKETKPISTAYYSAKYFRKELYTNRIPLSANMIFRPAYHGGLFTINTRGKFKDLYNYDIVSAYPYEICKLKSMENFSVVRYKGYVPDASYSVYHVHVHITDKYVGPLIYKWKGLCLNPVGFYEGTITKNEYEAIKHYDHEIIECYHVFCKKDTPFKNRMEDVFNRKCTSEHKVVWKYLANSLYGKTCQSIRKYSTAETDTYGDFTILDIIEKDGRNYYKVENIDNSNFIYASAITAKTRLRMYEQFKKYGDKIIAVQTDSLVSSVLLDLEVDPMKLGAWKLERWDEAYMIGSGVYFYRIGKEWKMKFRGFNIAGEKVEKILDQMLNSDKTSVEFDVNKRYSIQESRRIHDDSMANIIIRAIRKLNINFDRKRIWLGKWDSGKEVATKVIPSIAIFLKDFS